LNVSIAPQAELVDDRQRLGEMDEEIDICEKLLHKSNAARSIANKALQALAVQDSAAMLSILKTKEAQFLSLDPSWPIEQEFYRGMAGDMGGRRLEQKVEQMLPTPDEPKELAAVLQQLHGLAATSLYKFCSLSSQGSVNVVVEMIASMVQGRAPKLPSHPSAFTLAVKCKLPNFCKATIEDGNKTLFGKDALLHYMRQIESTPEADRTLDMFEVTSVFGWLFTRPEAATVRGWLNAVMTGTGSGSSHSQKEAAAAAASSSSSSSKPGAGEQALKDAMVMFG
jgi:hypothetical protein